MTERRTNRLIGERIAGFGKGTPEAGLQLQQHCDTLNAMVGDRYWFVAIRVDDDGNETRCVDNRPRREAKVYEPPCAPREAAEILRSYARQGFKFAERWAAEMKIDLDRAA